MAKEEKNNYLVVGLGRFGKNLAATLYENGHDVLAVDNDMSVVQSVIDEKVVANAMQLDATDISTLQKLELEKFTSVIISIGSDIEDSVLIAATMKDLGVKHIVAKASNNIHGKILERIGVDTLIYPEAEMGKRVGRQLIGLSFLEEFALNENFSIAEVHLPKQYASSTLAETDIRSDHHLNVLAIRRAGGQFNVSPTPKTSLQKNDSLLVLGTHEDIETFKNLVEKD